MKKIVIIGPESTGKSTLSTQLAAHYNTIWVEEYAREYLLQHGTDYSFEDLLTIAKGQLALEDEKSKLKSQNSKEGERLNVKSEENSKFKIQNLKSIIPNPQSTIQLINHPPLFIDTDMYVMKVWCEYVFGHCHHFILQEIATRQYDLYLLCNIDLPWVKDELREYPDEKPRQELYHIYKDILINQSTPWVDISGSYEERLQKAVQAVDELLKA